MLREDIFDLVVIGGGINGAGIAADASGRNLKVALFEAEDFACSTSSASSKLIHGGLRYLEQYEFRLVKEALKEREVLLKKAPFLIWPLRFRLPHSGNLRPVWLIRLGLFIYDNLAKCDLLPKSRYVKFDSTSLLQPQFSEGFEYSDCWVDDARLVITNVVAAKENGAFIQNRCKLINARRQEGLWHLKLMNNKTHQFEYCKAKALVNVAGPWVQQVLEGCIKLNSPQQVRLIKGSHIIIEAWPIEEHAYLLQNTDGRIVFVIPYLENYLMIGTTDKDYHGNVREVSIDEDEIDYLLDVYNSFFKKKITRRAIINSFSGVRPLYTNNSTLAAQKITRDYCIELNEVDDTPLISVFGGKLTTYRKLAETVVDKLKPFFPKMGASWTVNCPLPGAEGISSYQDVEQMLHKTYGLDKFTSHRLATSYGSRVWAWLSEKSDISDEFGQGLGKKEVNYLIENEYVYSAEDLLWRRSKLGLFLTPSCQDKLRAYIESYHSKN